MDRRVVSLTRCFVVLTLVQAALVGCRRDEGEEGSHQGGRTADVSVTAATPGAPRDTPTPTPTRTPPDTTAVFYTVQPGDTLTGIATAHGTTVEELMRLNGMVNGDFLTVGQELRLSMEAKVVGPGRRLLPDSEVVYGPSYAGFDVASETAAFDGFFSGYSEDVGGQTLTGPEIVQRISEQYSVGPRVLLALLELRSGWLTNPEPEPQAQLYPLGYDARDYWDGLYMQLSLAANVLNDGFYGWLWDTLWLVQLEDGTYVRFSGSLNAATAGVQRALAAGADDYAAWTSDLDRFSTVYWQLFGDPYAHAVEPLLPPESVPSLFLPWPKGETWYFTGGPHPGWGSLGAWSALDFTTGEQNLGCVTSQAWVTAAAPGHVLVSREGEVLQELDDDGFLGTGWVLLYMHLATEGRVAAGTSVDTGDRLGHPSCEGGVSNASHLHIARRYNGVWVPAHHPEWPMILTGWHPGSDVSAYDGTLTRGAEERVACECWDEINAVRHEIEDQSRLPRIP